MTMVAGTPVTDQGMFLGGLENLDDPKLDVSPKQYQKWLKAYTKEYFRWARILDVSSRLN